MRRERHNLSMLTAFTSALNHMRHPICKLLVWPRRALKVNLPVRTQELNLLLYLKSPKSSAYASCAWHHSHPLVSFPIWGFILKSMDDTSTPRMCEHLCSCLHLTNRKVLILAKPKSKIYKTKSLCNYITLVSLFCELLSFYQHVKNIHVTHTPKPICLPKPSMIYSAVLFSISWSISLLCIFSQLVDDWLIWMACHLVWGYHIYCTFIFTVFD